MQFVSVGNASSDFKYVYHGVSQGSVLGLLLFLIYLNDLHIALHFSEVEHFADDTSLFQFGNSPVLLGKRITQDLKFLISWLNANKISLNSGKTSISVPQTPSAPLFHDFKILTIFDLVNLLNILFIHKYLIFNLPSDLCDAFSISYILIIIMLLVIVLWAFLSYL